MIMKQQSTIVPGLSQRIVIESKTRRLKDFTALEDIKVGGRKRAWVS
jgi:hypothetical protein